jgi:hypothetical protein
LYAESLKESLMSATATHYRISNKRRAGGDVVTVDNEITVARGRLYKVLDEYGVRPALWSFEAGQGQYSRSDGAVCWTEWEPVVRHTCTPDGRALPFGRKAPEGQCRRCDELRNGAAPRAPHPAIQAGIDRRTNEARQLAELEKHFASEQHRFGGCGLVCTYGQW